MRIDLIKGGENEYRIDKDGVLQCTITRHYRWSNFLMLDVEPAADFKKRAIDQFDSYVEAMRTFKPNRTVIKSIEF